MSRDDMIATRCTLVWVVVTSLAVGLGSLVGGSAMTLLQRPTWHSDFGVLLEAVACLGVLACCAWAWLVTTLTVAEVLTGRTRHPARDGFLRRIVLSACGVAVAASLGSPAWAADTLDPDQRQGSVSRLSGLPLPDRAVGARQAKPSKPAQPRRPAQPNTAAQSTAPGLGAASAKVTPLGQPASAIRVRSGDSLWRIAAARLGPNAQPDEIAVEWKRIYAANVGVIGTDPDLIRPGQRLALPEHQEPTQ